MVVPTQTRYMHTPLSSHDTSLIINIIKTEEDKANKCMFSGSRTCVRAKSAVPAFIHFQISLTRCKPRMFTPPRCEPGALHPLPAHPASLNCEYIWLCPAGRRAPYRAPPRPYAAATASAPQPKVKDEKPPGGAFTRDEERPPCRPLPSAACHGALFSPVGSMARR